MTSPTTLHLTWAGLDAAVGTELPSIRCELPSVGTELPPIRCELPSIDMLAAQVIK